MTGEHLLEKILSSDSYLYVGREVKKIDSLDKVCGKEKYLEDIMTKGVLHAKAVRSPVAHGWIKKVDINEAMDVEGVVCFVDSSDVLGENLVGYIPEMPVFAVKKVRFIGEPILLVVGEEIDSTAYAADLVKVDIEKLPPILDVTESLSRQDVLIHEEKGTNLAFEMKIVKGDVDKALESADVVVSNVYKISPRDHAYIEREGALAVPDGSGKMTVFVQNQNPHVVQLNIARVLGWPPDRITVIQPSIGGSFGGKNDMGIIVAAQAAVAALKARQPVMLTFSREESLIAHSKSESGIVKYTSAASSDGQLLAADVEIIYDSGAYAIRSPGVLYRTAVEITNPYYVPNARVLGKCVYTNKIYMGAMRGFGTPTAAFTAEMQIEAIASKLGMDPVDIRLKNILKTGMTTVTGQVLDDNIDFERAIKEVKQKSGWEQKRQKYASEAVEREWIRRGIGIGCAWHGISVGWGYGTKKKGEIIDYVGASAKITDDGRIQITTGIVEYGQGTSTALVQVAAETLKLPTHMFSIKMGVTDAPETGGTHASRGLSIGGLAVIKACEELLEKIVQAGADILNCSKVDIEVTERGVGSKGSTKVISWPDFARLCKEKGLDLDVSIRFKIPRGEFDPETGQGNAFLTYTFTAIVAEIEVDTLTGEIRPLVLWPSVAAGRIINPSIAKDQVIGGTVFGLGSALMEEILFNKNGGVLNASLSTYLVPTICDTPIIMEPIFVEDISKYGAMGAKGIGEISSSAILPAIASALHHATGIVMNETPLSKEKVWHRLVGKMK